jgi:hypothetical protein
MVQGILEEYASTFNSIRRLPKLAQSDSKERRDYIPPCSVYLVSYLVSRDLVGASQGPAITQETPSYAAHLTEPNRRADELGMGEGLCGRVRHRKDPIARGTSGPLQRVSIFPQST